VTKMERRDIAAAAEVLDMIGRGEIGPGLARQAADCAVRIGRLAAPRRLRPSGPPRAKGETKEQRRDARRKRAADIREAVFVRADGKCECCRQWAPTEWHHVLSAGDRRRREAFETTAAVCAACHGDLHRNKVDALLAMWRWAGRHEYADAGRAITKRLDKIEEAQRGQHPEASEGRTREAGR
jgi:hypothetical protein